MQEVSERISVLDIFKIGIGPSSSHTMGPWKAAQAFVSKLESDKSLLSVRKIKINLYGSLAKTGKGHGTDMAVILGLSGYDPQTIDVNLISHKVETVKSSRKLPIGVPESNSAKSPNDEAYASVKSSVM